MFQTTKSKKGSVHDVHFVASLATVKVYNGIGWKKRYKAPTEFCFALKPPEVQEKKAHIRYLCAENEFVKWGWYSMVRINEITRVTIRGVKSLWVDCRFIPADLGSYWVICTIYSF